MKAESVWRIWKLNKGATPTPGIRIGVYRLANGESIAAVRLGHGPDMAVIPVYRGVPGSTLCYATIGSTRRGRPRLEAAEEPASPAGAIVFGTGRVRGGTVLVAGRDRGTRTWMAQVENGESLRVGRGGRILVCKEGMVSASGVEPSITPDNSGAAHS